MKYLNMKKRKLTFLFLILLCFGNIGMAMADNTEVHQSQRKITGRVMDVNGELLIGVNVMEVATTNGTVTDINGTYIITLTSERPVLRFTYVGFRVKEVTVGTQGIIDVTLEEDVEALDEVVVVGYGTQKKASVVGSITNIEPGKLQLTPSRSLSNNLAGMVSGVIAVQRSGDRGSTIPTSGSAVSVPSGGTPTPWCWSTGSNVPCMILTPRRSNRSPCSKMRRPAQCMVYGVPTA